MLNTVAESVDDIVAASRKQVISESWNENTPNSDIAKIKPPVQSVVNSTPTVESVNPGPSTGFISPSLVSTPPVKR